MRGNHRRAMRFRDFSASFGMTVLGLLRKAGLAQGCLTVVAFFGANRLQSSNAARTFTLVAGTVIRSAAEESRKRLAHQSALRTRAQFQRGVIPRQVRNKHRNAMDRISHYDVRTILVVVSQAEATDEYSGEASNIIVTSPMAVD
jgi:hypothetical protein